MTTTKNLKNIKSVLWMLGLAAWTTALTLGLSLSLGFHFTAHAKEPLRFPASARLSQETSSTLVAHHFLSLKCSCSKKLISYLTKRGSHNGVREIVHLVHAKPEIIAALEGGGFVVESLGEEEAVSRYNLHSLPQFLVLKNEVVLYQGGYGPDQQHSEDYRDLSLIAQLQRGETTEDFPLFGCANGQLRKSALDFLGIKYGSLN